MAIALDDVCTEAQLDEFLGGQLAQQISLCPGGWANAEPARAYALRRTLQVLARRTPPILESEISVPAELHDAVVFGACARIFNLAMTSAGESEVMFHQSRAYQKQWQDEVDTIIVTTPQHARAASRAPAIYRR